MFFSSLPTNTFELASWVWRNREHIPSLPLNAADLIQRAIENVGEGIRRIGSSVVLGMPDGGQQVLAFIDQVPRQLAAVEAGQQAISSSLASLQAVSAVSLGVAALSPTMLGGQFLWLRSQFRRIHKRLDRLEKLIDDQTVSRLKAGLDALESGSRHDHNSRIDDAFLACDEALHTFSSRLGDVLQEPKKNQDRKIILHLTQHLSVAICAAARCDIALGHDDSAEQTLSRHRPTLVRSSRAVFHQTLDSAPGRFLKPNLTDDHGGIEFLRSVVQQAKDNDVLENDHSLSVASRSLPAFVEYLLGEAPRGGFFWRTSPEVLKDELRDAAVSVEDTSRVLSLRSMIDRARKSGVSTRELIERVELEKQSATSPFVAWAV